LNPVTRGCGMVVTPVLLSFCELGAHVDVLCAQPRTHAPAQPRHHAAHAAHAEPRHAQRRPAKTPACGSGATHATGDRIVGDWEQQATRKTTSETPKPPCHAGQRPAGGRLGGAHRHRTRSPPRRPRQRPCRRSCARPCRFLAGVLACCLRCVLRPASARGQRVAARSASNLLRAWVHIPEVSCPARRLRSQITRNMCHACRSLMRGRQQRLAKAGLWHLPPTVAALACRALQKFALSGTAVGRRLK
jgi:hypothetical protein